MKEKFCCQNAYGDPYAPEMQDSTQYSTTEKQAKHSKNWYGSEIAHSQDSHVPHHWVIS